MRYLSPLGTPTHLTAGSPAILVGTIDSGVADVPDLAGKVDQRWSVSRTGKLTRDTVATDLVGHGTAVASLIAANDNDGFGMGGFGGATHLVAIRARSLTPVATAVALMKLDALGVRIVNMSFGADAPERPIMLDAIHKAAADGMLLIAAAGNSARPVAHPPPTYNLPAERRATGSGSERAHRRQRRLLLELRNESLAARARLIQPPLHGSAPLRPRHGSSDSVRDGVCLFGAYSFLAAVSINASACLRSV